MIPKKNNGAALIVVIMVMAVMIILGGAAVTTASSTQLSTINQHNTEQAYFTARAAVNTTMKYIQKYSSDTTKMNVLMSNTGTGSLSDMGSYTVNVSYTDSNKNTIKVSSSASYKGTNSTVVAYLTKPTIIPVTIPTNYAIYVDGNVKSDAFSPGIVNGPVYIDGDFNLSYGSIIKGKLISTGKITISGGSGATNGIIGFGDVELDGGGSVNGDALVKGNLTFGGGTAITGNVQCDGNLNMPQGIINGTATNGGNVTFSGGAPKILSNLNYKGTLSYAGGTIANWVKGVAQKTSSYTGVDLSSYTSATLPAIIAPILTNNVTISNKIINSSGILNSSIFNSLNYGDTVTIDTTSGDINLLVNTNFEPEKGLKFVVTGSHNVYIYLTGSSSFTVGSNQFIGMNDKSLPSKIFIIGDGSQSVSLSNCELDANIYIPQGSFSAGGGAPSTYMLQGTCIVNSLNIASQISINYSQPNITGTPLQILSTGQSSGIWSIARWANN